MRDVWPLLQKTTFPPLSRGDLRTLQVNVGYRCNLSCQHCHVSAGPHRTEEMSTDIARAVIDFLRAHPGVDTLDITGGAPELNAHFRWLVAEARALGRHVIDRCNLSVLALPGMEDIPEFLARHRVDIVASLPCYLEENVDRQRGAGAFSASLEGLRRLNAQGYGREGAGLDLALVYNPQGSSLPPAQAVLEPAYREHLRREYGVEFTRLLVLANMPVGRFGSMLASKGEFDAYLATLRSAHREANLSAVMCRELLSVDWRGRVFDCDFNQQLGLGAGCSPAPTTLVDLVAEPGAPIRVAEHCWGCTAGQGSSCGGALGDPTSSTLARAA